MRMEVSPGYPLTQAEPDNRPADIGGSNIVFTAPQLAHLPEEALFEVIGSPRSVTLARVDGQPLGSSMPTRLVGKAGWDDWFEEDEEDIRLIDWGEAFVHGAAPDKIAQPRGLEAPEIIFTGHFDHRVDLWRAGCTVRSRLVMFQVRD